MVPNGWKKSKIGEISNILVGRDVKEEHFSEFKTTEHCYPVYSNTVSNRGLYGFYDFAEYKNPAVTVVGRGIGLGTAFSRQEPFGAVGRLLVLEPKDDSFDVIYLSNYINNYLRIHNESGGIPQLPGTAIARYEVELPPLPEQQKIAKILTTWDKAIDTTERLIDNSKQQKKALMQQLLTGKKRLLDDNGKRFEGEWDEYTLEQAATYRRGSFPQPYGDPRWVDEVNGYSFVQVYDIDKNMKLKSETKIKISDAAIDKSVFIPKDTIVVSLQGSIGRVAITQYDAYVDRTILLFQEFLKPMSKVFFAYIIQELFDIEKTKAPGGTIKTITKAVLSNFRILTPSLEEQQKIAAVLTNADKEIDLLEQQLADLQQEKKALMQVLLTGKKRVVVDGEVA